MHSTSVNFDLANHRFLRLTRLDFNYPTIQLHLVFHSQTFFSPLLSSTDRDTRQLTLISHGLVANAWRADGGADRPWPIYSSAQRTSPAWPIPVSEVDIVATTGAGTHCWCRSTQAAVAAIATKTRIATCTDASIQVHAPPIIEPSDNALEGTAQEKVGSIKSPEPHEASHAQDTQSVSAEASRPPADVPPAPMRVKFSLKDFARDALYNLASTALNSRMCSSTRWTTRLARRQRELQPR